MKALEKMELVALLNSIEGVNKKKFEGECWNKFWIQYPGSGSVLVIYSCGCNKFCNKIILMLCLRPL